MARKVVVTGDHLASRRTVATHDLVPQVTDAPDAHGHEQRADVAPTREPRKAAAVNARPRGAVVTGDELAEARLIGGTWRRIAFTGRTGGQVRTSGRRRS